MPLLTLVLRVAERRGPRQSVKLQAVRVQANDNALTTFRAQAASWLSGSILRQMKKTSVSSVREAAILAVLLP